MNFADVKKQLGEYLSGAFEEVQNEAGELVREFQRMLERRPVRMESGADDAEYDVEEDLIEEIRALVKQYNEKREQVRKQRGEVEKTNLREKQALLQEMMRVISEEENISKAYQTFNELKDKWRTIGAVPHDKHHEIQKEFSRISELFYYNMNIYKELRENDLKKNTGSKQNLLERLTALAEKNDLRELETGLKNIQREWDHTGAVIKEKWEEMKTLFWDSVKKVEEKVIELRKEREEKQKLFLEQKKALIEKAKQVVAEERENQKDWDKATETIIALQTEWKTIGFAAREENEKVWQEFREVCDGFFNEKKGFYGELKGVFDENKKKKQELIEKAEAIKDSTNWKEDGDKLIQLQKAWQKLGSAGRKAEHPLWIKFRAACDHFFNRKKEYFASQEVALHDNLRKKEEFIASLATVSIEGTDDEKIAKLDALSKEFGAMGDVPFKEKERLGKAFTQALDDLSQRINIDPNLKETTRLKTRIAALQQQDNSDFLLRKEKQILRDKINRNNDEIIKIENNLGFFGNSKGASELLKDYQNKIEELKKQNEALKEKLKLFPKN
ncbi:MAG TPA: DUF349 domain-containing protein [Flavobacteriales bacterium]|nr:DUF349 domain-containing protein [Flavobacteriales bacterium]HRE96137.1 DUF349 domain-containing protein [Flavobacteriales bacterium]HRJ37394.1 DUF349 domain-containing protein [Flavobacteriales bacterium]